MTQARVRGFMALAFGVFLSVLPPEGAFAVPPRALLFLEPLDAEETRALVEDLESLGSVEHVVPGKAVIGRFEGTLLPAVASTRGIRELYSEGAAPPSDASDPLLRGVVAAWQKMTAPHEAAFPSDAARIGPPLAGDASFPPLPDEAPGPALSAPPGANFFDTSEFFLGSMTLCVLFPESDGTIDPNQENWTPAEEADVVSEVMSAMDWWVARAAEINHPLSFVYDFRFSIDQGYEPITRHSNDHPLWVAAVMTALGYTDFPGQFNNVRDLLNDERDTFGTDWAVASFVIDDTVDPDDMFTGGYFAFSYYGGPYYWMTYGNAGWGIANMDMIAAHELGHSFYAFDEYASSGCSCLQSMGYLNARNQNCDAGCSSNNPACIMRSSMVPISANVLEFYSARQLGLIDTDGDAIPNILDENPHTTLDPFGADTTTDDTPTYAGSGAANPKPNLNTAGQRHNITLNVISLVEYRVDGGAWSPATPADGVFDDSLEAFTFTTSPLAIGSHVVEARSIHSYGNPDTIPAADTLFIAGPSVSVPTEGNASVLPLSASPNPSSSHVMMRFEMASTGRARLSVFSSEGRKVADIADRVFLPGEHEIAWDGRLASGVRAAPGIYLFRLEAPDRVEMSKAVLLR